MKEGVDKEIYLFLYVCVCKDVYLYRSNFYQIRFDSKV